MGININSKILLSVASIAAATALIVGATVAFFSDTETSSGNTFTAGSLDLKVDSQCHYFQDSVEVGCGGDGNWAETDLGTHKFFNFNDVKPGDRGEDTISLHVVDNDAWAWFRVTPTADSDVTCTEPETESTDPQCSASPAPAPGDGELQEALEFSVWLDDGATLGFQCGTTAPCAGDPTEGNNVKDGNEQFLTNAPGPIDNPNESYSLWQILSAYRLFVDVGCTDDADGDGVTAGANGTCQGLPDDGHLVGSTSYYFGIEWILPEGTGNEVQSDSFVADMEFQVQQYRNNPSPSFPL